MNADKDDPAGLLIKQALQRAEKLVRSGQFQQAAGVYEGVLSANPGNPNAAQALAAIMTTTGNHGKAADLWKVVLKTRPRSPTAHIGLGMALAAKGELLTAIGWYEKANRIDDTNERAHFLLANAYRKAGDREKAIASYRRAIELKPDFVAALSNLGGILHELCHFEEAASAYERALSIRPNEPFPRRNLATLQLLLGRYEQGWRNYLARGSMDNAPSDLFRSILPASLQDKRVLVVRDQGLGDEIFFLRFLPRLSERGASVFYRPGPRLAAMLRRAAVADIVEEDVPCDLKISVGDLPYVLGTTDDTEIPTTISLTPVREQVEAFGRLLRDFGTPPYVAVTWRAGTERSANAQFRETPMTLLARSLSAANARVVAIQRNPKTGEVAAFEKLFGRPVLDLTASNEDLEAMLALVGLLDEYVCVDNTNVHLRSALGRPCRILVPQPTDFRSMADGDESPWFPGTRLYRQSPGDDWGNAFAQLERDLRRTRSSASGG